MIPPLRELRSLMIALRSSFYLALCLAPEPCDLYIDKAFSLINEKGGLV